MIRAIALAVALVACKTHTIELGTVDAAIDAPGDALHACRCRVPCPTATTTTCGALIPGSTCGLDGYCMGSVGVCTGTTPSPCALAAPASVCRANDTSALPCPF